MASFIVLLLTLVVITVMTVLQFVPLVVVMDRDGSPCLPARSTGLATHETTESVPVQTDCQTHRLITMWGRRYSTAEVTYWDDAAEPKTEITSLCVLAAAVLLFIAMCVMPTHGSRPDAAAASVKAMCTAKAPVDEVAKDDVGLTLAVQVDEAVSTTSNASSAHGCWDKLVVVLAAMMLGLGLWCLATFHEKWHTTYGDRFQQGYYLLLLVALPAMVLICGMLMYSSFARVWHALRQTSAVRVAPVEA